ncbi:Protein lethal(2)essential for life [Strongyloides ratti]|uniref:Protein lethal(2)essential for life n=1 Tax=Strongyloides ratti TaxID=34506 RepID=A0A090N0C5_STRRB|nr:Protein lethal(2)essential for life [Strongyloides ratti]CEF70447.1 Protein lethal(2)essential for life [Strongyloides ratti]
MEEVNDKTKSSTFIEAKRFFKNAEKLMETPLYWTHSKFNDKHEIDDRNVQIKDTSSEFSIKMDVSKFSPNKLNVDIRGRCLIVKGKCQEKDKNSITVKKTFIRSYSLPHNVKVEEISSELSDEGVLTIHQKKNCVDNDNIKIIPITF